jgi:hypothetical protein
MKPNKPYLSYIFLFCAISALTLFIGSCSDEDPDESFSAPEMTVSGTNNLGRTTATVSGQFSGKLSRVKEYGVKYSTSSLFPEDQTTRVSFEGAPSSGNFSTQLTNLNSNTQYYYCLYATTGSTEVTSDLGSFSTVSTSKPTFDEISLDSIGENVVAVRFRIIEIGDEYLVEQGVSYRKKATGGTEESFVPMTTDSVSNAGEREYVAVIYNLTANTTYEIRPYAKNASDASGDNGMIEGYGDTQTFTTEAQKSPLVVTDDIDSGSVGISSVVLSGMITTAPGSNGKLDEVGFCYSENRQEPTWLDNRLIIDDATQLNTTYTATLKGLKENTTYYVRMYAKNTVDGSARYGYGETKQFTTGQLSTPIFDEFTNVSAEAQSITLTANLSNYDEGATVEKGFYWATSINDCTLEKAAILGNSMKVTDGGRAFSATITGLSVGVLYYVAAYAVYQSDQREATGYSDPYPVTTSGFTIPVLNTPVISDETYFGATVTGVIRSQGNGQITSKGFVVSRDYDEPTIDYCDFHAYADDNFQHTFTELNNGTFYYVRAYVVCELAGQKQTVYSDYTTFSTTAVESAVLKDLTVTDVTQSGAKFASGLNSAGDGELTEAGFIWAASADLSETLNLEKATGKQKVELTGSMDNFELTLTDLKYSTEYKARAYVKTLVDGKLEQVSYSGTVYFSTSDPQSASLSNFSYTNVSLHSIDVSIEIGSAGDGTMVEKGFCWVPTESISYWSSVTLDNAENHIAVTDGTETAFQATITGLTADTQYRIAAYVITELDGVKRNAYSEYRDVSTAAAQLPSMNAPTVSNVNFFDATFKLNMYDEGNYTLTRKGVCLSATRSDPVINDCDYVQDFGQDNTCTVSQLKPGTTYYARSFAVCALEGEETTTYSDARTFSTSEITAPSMKNITVSNILFTSFDLACGVRETGDGEITEKGFCWVKTSDLSDYWAAPTLDNATGSLAISDGDADSFSGTASSLEMNVEYRVAAYVKYQVGNNQYSGVAYSENTSVSTATPELPSLSAPEVSDITYKAATFTYQLSSAGNYEITERGVVLSKSSSSPDIHSHDATATYDSDGVCTLTGLDRETTYYYRSYAKCKLNYDEQVVYSDGNSFSTSSVEYPTLGWPTEDNVSITSADLTFHMMSEGSYQIIEQGICVSSNTSSPSTSNYEYLYKVGEDGKTTFSLTNLAMNTTYYARCYVICQLEDDASTRETRYSTSNGFTTGSVQAATFWNEGYNSVGLTTASVYATIDQLGDGELVEKGFIWNYASDSSELTLDNCRGSVKVSGDDYTFEAELTELPINTDIRVSAYAKTSYNGNVQVGYSGQFTLWTNSISIHSVNTSSDGSTATISYSFYDDITSLLKETGVVYSTDSSLEAEAMTSSAKATANEDDSLSYSVTLNDLENSKAYHFYIYVKTEGGTSYFGKYEFSTKALPGIDDISSPGKRD